MITIALSRVMASTIVTLIAVAMLVSGTSYARAIERDNGKTFYIDSRDGDDGNDGLSPVTAWRSIGSLVKYNADQTFSPGDAILFRRGATYFSNTGVQFQGSGSPGNPITIGAYAEGSPPRIIIAGPEVKPWTNIGGGIWEWRYSGDVVNGLWEDTQPLLMASDDSLSDGAWYFKKGAGIYYKPSSYDPAAHVIHRASPGGGFAFGGNSFIQIRDLHFMILGLYLSPARGLVHDIVIENNIFENIVTPIQLFSRGGREISDITIENNHMRRVGYGVRVHSGNGVERALRLKISGNVIEDIDEQQIYTSWHDGFYDNEALSFQNINDSEVSGNHIRGGGALGGGIVQWTNPKSEAHRNRITGNYICGISGSGMGLFNSGHKNIHQQNVISNNIICNLQQNKDIRFPARNKDEGMGGLRLNGYDTTYSNLAYNNTVFNYDHNVFFNSFAIGWVLKNNLSERHSVSNVWRREGAMSGAVLDFNHYGPSSRPGFLLGVYPKKYNISRWKAQGVDKMSVQAEAKFVNSSGHFNEPEDFAPRWDSPVIDAGTDIDIEEEDYLGNPIYGPRDIGAIEYQPPYTMGVDPVDIAGNVRVYGDGRFRNTSRPSGDVALLSVRPQNNNTREWFDIKINEWGHTRAWTVESVKPYAGVMHYLDGFYPNENYIVYYVKNNSENEVLGCFITNSIGELSFLFDEEFMAVKFMVEFSPRGVIDITC